MSAYIVVHASLCLSLLTLGWRPAHTHICSFVTKPVHLGADRFSGSNPDRRVSLSELVCVCVSCVLGVQCLSCWRTIIELLLHRCAAWGDWNTVINRNPYRPLCVCFTVTCVYLCGVWVFPDKDASCRELIFNPQWGGGDERQKLYIIIQLTIKTQSGDRKWISNNFGNPLIISVINQREMSNFHWSQLLKF